MCRKAYYRNSYDVSVTARKGMIFLVTEKGDLVVYDGKTGEEKTRIRGFSPEATQETGFWNLYVSTYGENYVGSHVVRADWLFTTNHYRVYCLSKPEVPLGEFSVIYGGDGYLAAISKTQSWLFDGEGNVLLRFTLPVFY